MNETKTNDFLEKEKLGRLMLRYSIPCIISLLVAAFYNIVDQIFIANADYLGSVGNSANTVVFPLTVIALSISTMIGDGGCAFVSLSLGEMGHDDAHRSVGSSVISIIAAGIVLMAIYLIFQEQILTLFGATVSEETFRLSKEYFFWITMGIVFYMFGQAMNPIIRSDGNPGYAMATLLTGAIINIILDPICIYVLKWGMMGAAIATIFGQFVSAVMSFIYLFRMKAVKLDKSSFKFSFSIMKKVLPLGAASFFTQISNVLSLVAVLNVVAIYGAKDPIFSQPEYSHIPTAIVGIVMKFNQIVLSIAIGLSAGCIPVVGYNAGAGRNDRVRGLMKRQLWAEAIVGAFATVIFLVFTDVFINIFGGQNESVYYRDFARQCIRIFLCLLPLACFNKGTTIFLQSLGKAKESTVLAMLREIVFGVGLPILLPVFFGLYGILYYMPVADFLAFIPMFIVIMRINQTYKKNAPAPRTAAPTAKPAGDAKTNMIITIGRSYGAGGRTIGAMLAERLSIPYYDAALLEKAAAKSGLDKKYLESRDEKPIESSVIYRYFGSEGGDITSLAYHAQSEIIEHIADEGACVIVGRRADCILRERENVFSVFITASDEARAKRVSEREGKNLRESEKYIAKADKSRAAYYNQQTDKKWGEAESYDLCLNTDEFGIEGAVNILEHIITRTDAERNK